MKKGSVDVPITYLGAKILQVQLPSDVVAYEMSMGQYVQEAVNFFESVIKKKGLALNKKV